MTNILQAVQTYQASGLGLLLNENCFISTSNTKFKDFENKTANLGNTVTFDLPPRFVAQNSLVVSSFEGVQQRALPLTVNQQVAVPFAFDAEQLIFNIDNNNYREPLEKSAIAELGAVVEANVASNILTSTYRFYGDGTTAIDSFTQLASALAFYRNYGAPKDNIRGYLSDIDQPTIVGTGLNQFVMDRNEDLAMDWEIGRFSKCDWYTSNLLPLQVAGTVGNSAQTLTVISISIDGTQLTLSGATANDANAIKAGDLLQFQDNVSGQPNMRYLTFIGHLPSANPVQVLATANAGADGSGHVVITVNPPLISTVGNANQNLNNPIAAGMQLKALPSHRAGMISGGQSMFLAMPRLPMQSPFDCSNKYDSETGTSLRFTYGCTFGQNTYGFIYDAIWGVTIVPEYSMRLIFPA